MGYATVMNVPSIGTYKNAYEIWANAKPIARRKEEIRPMGNRRDADTYSIRKNGDDVECVLYKTPVITFKPNGDVMLYTDGWNTTATNQFIQKVLHVSAMLFRGKSIIATNGKRYEIPSGGRLTMRACESTQWEWDVLNAEKMYGHNFNRGKANIVRAKYKAFYDYVSNMSKVRKEVKKRGFYGDDTHECVAFSYEEFAEYFEPVRVGEYELNVKQVLGLAQKHDNAYAEKVKTFMELVQSDKAEDFHKALICVAVNSKKCYGTLRFFNEKSFNVPTKKLKELTDEIILMIHSEEVLDRVELVDGKLPNPKYMKWVV